MSFLILSAGKHVVKANPIQLYLTQSIFQNEFQKCLYHFIAAFPN